MKKIYLFAVIFALIAGVCTYLFVNNLQNNSKVLGEKKASVVVAMKDIPKNTAVTMDMFTTIELPVSSITYGTAANITDLVGRVAVENIYQGEQVLVAKLAIMGEDIDTGRLSYELEDGVFAYTFTVDEESAIAYNIREGDYINIYGYGASAQWTVLMENIKVLRIGNYSDNTQSGGLEIATFATVTVEVTAEQIDLLLNGNEETGEITQRRLALVPYMDAEDITPAEVETIINENGEIETISFELEPQTNYGMGILSETTTAAAE